MLQGSPILHDMSPYSRRDTGTGPVLTSLKRVTILCYLVQARFPPLIPSLSITSMRAEDYPL